MSQDKALPHDTKLMTSFNIIDILRAINMRSQADHYANLEKASPFVSCVNVLS